MKFYFLNEQSAANALLPQSAAAGGSVDPSSGGVYGPLPITTKGFLFIGAYDQATGGLTDGGRVRVSDSVPQMIGFGGQSFADGIPLNIGHAFMFPDTVNQWYIGTFDTGAPGKTFVFILLDDECFKLYPMSTL